MFWHVTTQMLHFQSQSKSGMDFLVCDLLMTLGLRKDIQHQSLTIIY